MFVLVPDHPSTKMSITQLRICSILQQGPCPVSYLGREIGVTVSNISQIIERMVRIGLIERYVTPDDLRLRLVKLSPQGLQAMESRKKYRIERTVAALAKVEPSVRPEILSALQSLVDTISAASPFQAAACSAPGWVSGLVRETYVTTGRSMDDTVDDLLDVLE
jgi:DNA-binding MarR family transcriptional regulator